MGLSAIQVYRDVLPKTNCGDCGYPTCLAFAAMVVSLKSPPKDCPYIDSEKLREVEAQIGAVADSREHARGDMAEDALGRERKRALPISWTDLPARIGGTMIRDDESPAMEVPYFSDVLVITQDDISRTDNVDLTTWEKVCLYNHLSCATGKEPSGRWQNFGEILDALPDDTDARRKQWYMRTMVEAVEGPLTRAYDGSVGDLTVDARRLGAVEMPQESESADVRLAFNPLPRVPIVLEFWDTDDTEGFEAQARMLFDETISDQMDVDSILIVSQRIRQLLCGGDIF